jgi:hypothetical protein
VNEVDLVILFEVEDENEREQEKENVKIKVYCNVVVSLVMYIHKLIRVLLPTAN